VLKMACSMVVPETFRKQPVPRAASAPGYWEV
jgi:hypothetical protein